VAEEEAVAEAAAETVEQELYPLHSLHRHYYLLRLGLVCSKDRTQTEDLKCRRRTAGY